MPGAFLLWDILSRGCLGFSAGAALSALAGRPRLAFSAACSLTGFFSGAVSSFAGALFFVALKSSTFGAGATFSSGWFSTVGAGCAFGAASTTGACGAPGAGCSGVGGVSLTGSAFFSWGASPGFLASGPMFFVSSAIFNLLRHGIKKDQSADWPAAGNLLSERCILNYRPLSC